MSIPHDENMRLGISMRREKGEDNVRTNGISNTFILRVHVDTSNESSYFMVHNNYSEAEHPNHKIKVHSA